MGKGARPLRIALVLAGGSARGAYEVGVVLHIVKEVAREIGRPVPLDILCGTSVGAINVCALAAYADEPTGRADILASHWTSFRIDRMLRLNSSELLTSLASLVGRSRPPPRPGEVRRGGFVDPTGIEDIVRGAIPFGRVRDHIRAGRLSALSVSTTHVASGKTVVFVEHARGLLPAWGHDPTLLAIPAEIGADHALASAAVPFFFPAVRIGDDFYCDGGLRQNVPLSPARRMGADALIVVNPRFISQTPLVLGADREAEFPGPLFLAGKALNALLLDRIDNDIERLSRINEILLAGTRRHGPGFLEGLNEELGRVPPRSPLRPLQVVHIRASEDIGALAGEYVRSAEFASRAPGMAGSLLRRIGGREGAGEADLLSYLLFDGEFAARLIDLGRRDARAHHAQLCALFDARLPAG